MGRSTGLAGRTLALAMGSAARVERHPYRLKVILKSRMQTGLC